MLDTKVSPFPNGTSYMVWTEVNCDRCTKNDGCKLADALAVACCPDGQIAAEVAQAIGCEPEGYAPAACADRVDNGYVPPPPPPPMALVLRELRNAKEKIEAMLGRAGDLATYAEGSPYPEGDWGDELVDGALALVSLSGAIEIAEKAIAAPAGV